MDKAALDQQVKEKQERLAAEAQADIDHAKLSQYYADQVSILQQDAEGTRRMMNKQVDEFRSLEQGKSAGREWDLNRPDALLIDAPARLHDEDQRCGPASLQRFDGEDSSIAERVTMQRDQASSWWKQQTEEKAAHKAAEAEAEAAHGELIKYQDMLQNSAKAEEAVLRREVVRAQMDYNMRLAEEKKLRAQMEKMEDLAASQAEMHATATSGFLTENPNMAASASSPYRVRKDHYKGMTEAEVAAIQATQLAQMDELKTRREQERMDEVTYARTQADINRQLNEQVMQVDNFRRQQAARVSDVLKKQMDEKAVRDKARDDLYSNQVAPDYFNQFGTSHR